MTRNGSHREILADLMMDHQIHTKSRTCMCGVVVQGDVSLPRACALHMADMMAPLLSPYGLRQLRIRLDQGKQG